MKNDLHTKMFAIQYKDYFRTVATQAHIFHFIV